MRLKNKKVLITGGAGFIGTNLARKLEEVGANVTIFDLVNGHNIEDKNQLVSFIKKRFDVIYHLAGFSGSAVSNEQRLKCLNANVLATANLCESLVKFSPKTKLVISSSRLEYGKLQYLPVDELHPTLPTSIYGLSKLAATQMALIYHAQCNLNVTIFRTSNVYGPHPVQKFSGYNVINHFIDLAKRGNILLIYGDGNQERDYLFITDLVDAFILAILKDVSGQIYNLGFGKGIKFKNMVKLIIKKVGRGMSRFVEWPKNFEDVETGSYVSDISKIRKELDFEPKVGFEEGVERTVHNF